MRVDCRMRISVPFQGASVRLTIEALREALREATSEARASRSWPSTRRDNPDRRHTEAGHDGADRRARRRRHQHRFVRPERQADRVADDARARPGGDRGARLPAAWARPRLASGASHTIALFLPSPQWQLLPVQQTFVAGATQATSASDYALLLSTAATDPETIAQLVAKRTRRRRDPDGDAAPRSSRRASAGGRPPVHADRAHARHDRDQLRRHGLRRRGRDEPRAPRPARSHLRRLFNFPPDLLEAGYTSALIARDVFERRGPDLGIRGSRSLLARAARGVRGRGGLVRSEPECTAAITTGWQFTGLLARPGGRLTCRTTSRSSR